MEELSSKNIEDALCEESILNEIFYDLENKEFQLSKLNDSLCDETGKKFLIDIYNALGLKNFSEIVS